MKDRLYLYDTTLRDGAQTNGVDFTLADKLAIAKMLDDLGIDYVEGGYPGANPTDTRRTRITRSPARAQPTRRARAGSCCATPMAARCRTRSARSSPRW